MGQKEKSEKEDQKNIKNCIMFTKCEAMKQIFSYLNLVKKILIMKGDITRNKQNRENKE